MLIWHINDAEDEMDYDSWSCEAQTHRRNGVWNRPNRCDELNCPGLISTYISQVVANCSTTLSNIGLLHMMKNEDEKALAVYEKAVIILEEIYGCEHPRLGTVYHNLGDLCLRLRNNEHAKEYFEKALRIRLISNDIDANDWILVLIII
jgi:tetratricopeptide (TPR) repeat protein